MIDLLVHDCDILVVDPETTRLDTKQDIWIKDGRIDRVTASEPIEPGKASEVIEATGLLATPGLMNTHAHIPMALFRGVVEDVHVTTWFNDYIWPMESNLTPEDIYWGALLGMAEMIEAGITSVADHYFAMDEIAQAAVDAGMRANLSWAFFAHEGFAKLDQTSEFIQRWQGKGNGRITAWLGPHSPYTTTPELLRLCSQRAKDLGVGIHIHVSETAEQVQLSLKQNGITPVQELAYTGVLDVPSILAHCVFPTDEDIQMISSHPAGVAHAPKTYMKLGSGIPSLSRYRKAGVPVGLATDGAASNNSLNILESLRLMALTQKDKAGDPTVMPVAEALDIAFHGSAQVLQMGSELGDIAAGKFADITLLRQDGLHNFPRYNPAANLVYSTNASDVDTVICNGKILMRNRILKSLDKNEIKRQVITRLERLSRRIPEHRIAFYPSERT